MIPRALVRLAILGFVPSIFMMTGTRAQTSAADDGLEVERIFGVMPNYGTVNYPTSRTPALTVKQKWLLAWRETVDPFNFANAAIGAGLSQMGDQTPSYGEGMGNYGKRYAAAVADLSTQNMFSAGVLASVLRQDPRYFRKGPEYSPLYRVGYSLSRVVVARQDSGRATFNTAGIGGMALGIAASNLYYPRASVKWEVMSGRVVTSLTSNVIGNLTSEFWPDLQKFLHRHHVPLT
ncbi:MAG: hypothetical protein JSU00_24060 [Acidobacteria bacterium]|nr:hypothetical protein [Acidobacteriota bacterium]